MDTKTVYQVRAITYFLLLILSGGIGYMFGYMEGVGFSVVTALFFAGTKIADIPLQVVLQGVLLLPVSLTFVVATFQRIALKIPQEIILGRLSLADSIKYLPSHLGFGFFTGVAFNTIQAISNFIAIARLH